jgi:hypothetical protein
MAFVESVAELEVIKPAMHEVELHSGGASKTSIGGQ